MNWRPASGGAPALWGTATLYGILALALASITWLHSHDDAYITYVFARSFAGGLGLTWNGAPGLGTTSPLLAVLLGSLEKLIPLSIPVWGHLLAWTAIFSTAVFAFVLGRREGWPKAGFLLGLGWLVTPATVDFLGGEYPIAVFAVTAAAVACAYRKPLLLAPSLALAVGLRNEMAIAAVLLALAVVARDGWARGLRWLAPGAAGALGVWGAWLLTLWTLAGTALPATLDAKRAQADSPFPFWDGGARFLLKTWRSADQFFYPAGVWIFVTLAAAGLLALALRGLRRPPWALAAALALWGPVHLAALASIDVPYYPWYSVPLHFSWLLLAALTAELPGRLSGDRLQPALGIGAAVVLGALFLANGARNLQRHAGGTEDPRETTYRRLGDWISERYPPTTRVASFEVGYLGYHGRFETLDLLGLTTPRTPLDAVRAGNFPRVVSVLDPDLVLLPQPFVELGRALVGDAGELLERYELDRMHVETWPPVLVYRRKDFERRGDVTVDFLAAKDTAGGAFHVKNRVGAPALRVAPGAGHLFEIGPQEGLELVTAVAALRRPPAIARFRLLDGETEVARVDVRQRQPRWRRFVQPLPATDAGRTLELACRAESASPCLFAVPHLRRRTAEEGRDPP